jgi:hypothetical protein
VWGVGVTILAQTAQVGDRVWDVGVTILAQTAQVGDRVWDVGVTILAQTAQVGDRVWGVGVTILTYSTGTRNKNCPDANFSTIYPIWTGLRLNPDLLVDRPAVN